MTEDKKVFNVDGKSLMTTYGAMVTVFPIPEHPEYQIGLLFTSKEGEETAVYLTPESAFCLYGLLSGTKEVLDYLPTWIETRGIKNGD